MTEIKAYIDDSEVDGILNESLFLPIRDLFDRPSKMIRAELVHTGYRLAGEKAELEVTSEHHHLSGNLAACHRLADALEAIHAGSLIIDDVQDGSKERRGQASLHERYGVSVAINAGNWLYFEPFSWIKDLQLPESVELRIYRLCHTAMLNAHMGQAIDIGAKIEEIRPPSVRSICMSSLRLKTGALTTLALTTGATIGGASDDRIKLLGEFGERFGMALQMFDDIGNFNLPAGHLKRLEDFRLRRPTWLWAVAADHVAEKDYLDFVSAVMMLPNEEPLRKWMKKHDFLALARTEAEVFLKESMRILSQDHISLAEFPRALTTLHELAERIRTSYG